MKITRIESFRHKLGEGPIWDQIEQALYGTDVLGRKIWRYDPRNGDYDAWDMGEMVSSISLRETGGALLALAGGIYFFDFDNGKKTFVSGLGCENKDLKLNDGKSDRAGRFVYGNVHAPGLRAEAGLFSIEPDLRAIRRDCDLIITNGPCWNKDGNIFYFTDSLRKSIYAYDYDIGSGDVANRRLFATTARFSGIPDGATVDAEGYLWTALCEGSKILRIKPDGTVVMAIDMPTRLVSSVMFGGADLDRLFVTSMDGAAVAAEIPMAAVNPIKSDENSGALFVIDGLGIKGMEEYRFRG